MTNETHVLRPAPGSSRLLQRASTLPLEDRVQLLEDEAEKLALLLEVSRSLSSEMDLASVMAMLVAHTTQIMNCERSSVFLLDRDRNELYSLFAQGLDVSEIRFSAKVGIAGSVVRDGIPLNIPDAYADSRFNPAIDKATGFRTVSILCLPLIDRRGETIGVIQCLNKRGGVFNQKDEIFLSAMASQASVFLENSALYRQMDRLFEAFVEATSRSIDDRDPCTSGHSRRVMQYSLNLARAVHESSSPAFVNITYTRERMRQLRYACMLHDVGKIGVREHILCKAVKLSDNWMQSLRLRFALMREKCRGDVLMKCVKERIDPDAALALEHAPFCAEIDKALSVIEAANVSGFMRDGEVEALKTIREKGWISEEECRNLSIRRGNLTEEEWDDMRSHVTKSFRLLIQIPWPKELKDLPEVAYTHHEKYDGSGYPRKLKRDEIHFDGHVMCVADIYDALTAADRPYKKAIPHEKAQRILMEEEADKGRLMKELVELFFDMECYNISDAPSSRFTRIMK